MRALAVLALLAGVAAAEESPPVAPVPGDPAHVDVTFTYHGDAHVTGVRVEQTDLARVGRSDVWRATVRWPRAARRAYAFTVQRDDGSTATVADPLNPRRSWPPVASERVASLADMYAEIDAASLVCLPDCPGMAWLDPRPGVAAGRVEERTIDSAVLGGKRRVWVYTPPGFAADRPGGHDLLVVFDGQVYLGPIPVPTLLDNLLAAGKLPPTVAVFVDDTADRLGDLANHARFARFVAGELVPWARRSYGASSDPHRATVAGSSAGGLAAAYVGFFHPEAFGRVVSQSGAFWRGNEGASEPYEWLTAQIAAAPRRDVRFVLEIGGEETHRALRVGPVFRDTNRRLRDALEAKGYRVSYSEIDGAVHEVAHWRSTFADALLDAVAP